MLKKLSKPIRVSRRAVLAGTASMLASPMVIGSARAEAKSVNIGVIQPLSGANAQFGTNSHNGIQLVADGINAAGGIKALDGAKINLIVADATSTPTTAGNVAQRLITQNEVTAILGAFASSLTIAISDVTERRDIPLLTMSFADQLTERGFKSIFQVVAKASAIGKAQFDYTMAIAESAGGTKIDKVALMYEDTAYGTAQANGLRAGAKAANVQLVMDEAYPLGITDTTPLINKLRASGAQAVFPVSYLNDSLLIIRTMRQQKIDIPAIGGAAGYVIPDFEKGLGEFSENVLSVNTSNYDLAPDLTDRFRKRFGYFMVHEALEHAVALDVLVQAIEKAKSAKAEDVAAALRGGKFTGGWTQAMTGGAVEFDQTGLNVRSVPLMVQWRKKELVTVWPKEIAKAPAIWKS
jgi:branched-chain amino acid transport system substrate-binding protein